MIEKVLKLNQDGRLARTDVWASPNFSFKQVNFNQTIEVLSEQQMIVNESIKVEGFFRVDGEVYVFRMPAFETFPELPADNYSQAIVTSQKEVSANQEMILTQFMNVSGEMRVDGFVTILGTDEKTDDIIPNKILSDQLFAIGLNFEYYFRQFLNISGQLRCSGSFIVGV